MATTLKQNLNSDFINASTRLLSKKAAKKVLVYVESDEDIAFWYGILKIYETEKLNFDIQLPSRTSLAKGKHKALERNQDLLNLQVGEYLIICIDSDYDYLLQNRTQQATLINNSPFIFQTYAYSIENIRCYSASLDLICTQATNAINDKIDFEALLKLYSAITYPLFLWSVFFKFTNNTTDMNLTKFSQIIGIKGKVNINEQGKKHLETVGKNVNAQIAQLEKQFPNDIKTVVDVGKTLNTLGVNAENTYLFIHGHTIENSVILMFLNSLCITLRSNKEAKIIANAQHEEEKMVELNHYRNKCMDVDKALKNNTEYKSCFLYEKIKTDLDVYMGKIKAPSV